MPVSIGEAAKQFQPYECVVCNSRFTRSENLKRHSRLHTRSSNDDSLPCNICHATFSRPDLRSRHMKRKHARDNDEDQTSMSKKPSPTTHSQLQRQATAEGYGAGSSSPADSGHGSLRQSNDGLDEDVHNRIWDEILRNTHLQISTDPVTSTDVGPGGIESAETPTASLTDISVDNLPEHDFAATHSSIVVASGLQRISYATTSRPTSGFDSQRQPTVVPHSDLQTEYNNRNSFNDSTIFRWPSNHSSPTVEDWFPSESQTARGLELFFAHVSHFIPFLHRPTFDVSRVERYLALSILSLGFQFGQDPDCGDREGSGSSLSIRCFHQARHMISALEVEYEDTDNVTLVTVKVQSYLMLEICAMFYLCGRDSAHALRMHSRMISLARSGGLMQSVAGTCATHDLETLWHQFVQAESRKRTSLAVHQIDALWYQFLSIPRSISHLEIKHDLPCPNDCWTAPTASRWAHWQLVTKSSSLPVQYSDAVRLFLSPNPNLSSLPAFDPYGAINIAQFLISSAREISGWSAITGRISMERLEPLKESLSALGSVIRPEKGATISASAALCEATWEMAMIELHMWSPSHTGGIVEGSIDAVIKQLVDLAPTCEFLIGTHAAHSVQPRVNWFLRYLDDTVIPDTEPPWLTLYAYKAFLIALQLVRGHVTGAMEAVDIQDGDVCGAVAWARKVLDRRKRWQLGRLIISSLESLDVLDAQHS
ncbi:hypothetical protein LTR84_009295 [Exophiala bonariae]|uniref:C2H2-type domain-containing protein n=1 Tax=Exophiala bonariae TaxID=1690606 RepID=A0AAV9MVD2_9EURO|nr:hypothetical protein LTR84_009295 [Exophiala bonariae]